jgi:hypothetical protein
MKYEIMNFDDVGPKTSKFNRLLCQNNKIEGKFTSTCEKIQNQCILKKIITFYFEFECLFINKIEVICILYYQCHCLVHV